MLPHFFVTHRARSAYAMATVTIAAFAAGLPLPAFASPGCRAVHGVSGNLNATNDRLLPFGYFNAGDRISVNFSGPASGAFKFSLIGENEQDERTSTPGTVAVDVSSSQGLIYAVDLYLSPGASASLAYQVSCDSALPQLAQVSPASGSGGMVTLTGTGFYGTTAVRFGSLPAPSFIVDNAGRIMAKTPPGVGTQTVTVTTDAGTTSNPVTYSFQVPTIALGPTTLADGTYQSGYSRQLQASGGTGPYAYAVTAGQLPTGLLLNPVTGIISGTPNAAGDSNFTITATDDIGYTGSQPYSMTIQRAAQTLAFSSTPPAAAIVGERPMCPRSVPGHPASPWCCTSMRPPTRYAGCRAGALPSRAQAPASSTSTRPARPTTPRPRPSKALLWARSAPRPRWPLPRLPRWRASRWSLPPTWRRPVRTWVAWWPS